MDSRNLAIGVLSTTAVILLVGLVLVQSRPAPVLASGMVDRGGDYIMLSGELWEREELLYIIDAQTQRMITYRYDLNRKIINAAAGEELDKYMNPAAAQPPNPRSRSGQP